MRIHGNHIYFVGVMEVKVVSVKGFGPLILHLVFFRNVLSLLRTFKMMPFFIIILTESTNKS